MKKLILGIGNTLNRDEGLGVHSVELLKKEYDSDEIEFMDGGTLGLNLLPVVEECSHLLFIDTIISGKDPGSITQLSGDEIPLFKDMKVSNHQTTFLEVLGFAKLRGKLPESLFFLGMEPEDTSLGVEISETVKKAMPALISKAKEIVKHWQPE